MKKYIDDFSLWIGIISGVASLFAFLSGETPLSLVLSILVISVFFFVVGLYLHIIEKRKYPSEIDGIHINALDLLDSTFDTNSHLRLTEAHIKIHIDKQDYHYVYHYKGKVIRNLEPEKQGIFFNIANERNDVEKKNSYYGYDNLDTNSKEAIPLYEVSPQGMSKKLFFPFQTTLSKGNSFDVSIHGDVYNCFPLSGTTYYFVRFSFNSPLIRKFLLKYNCSLLFHQKPIWVHKSIITNKKQLKREGSLAVKYDKKNNLHICNDDIEKTQTNDIYVYTFNRK